MVVYVTKRTFNWKVTGLLVHWKRTTTKKDLLEIAGSPDVSLCQFLPLAFHLLFFLVKATVHHVVHVGIVVEAHIVNFWVLDVHCRHWQRGPWTQHIKQ